MKLATILTAALLTSGVTHAFPPAPHHEVYGMIRNEHGDPLSSGASVTLSGSSGAILSGVVDPFIEPGANYSLKVPMDAGTLAQLYRSTAMRPAMPFTVTVTLAGTDYAPIEVQGGMLQMGEPGGRTRLDLTLGVDSDGDGLPDAWEREVIAGVRGLDGLVDVTRDGDSDGDGVSNYAEYLAGTYAFDGRAAFRFEVIEVRDGLAHLRFLAVKGRTYRVLAGITGEDFSPVGFSLRGDGTQPVPFHRANSIRFQDIYVPAQAPGGNLLFRLHVE